MPDDDPLSDEELEQLERLSAAASPAPWTAFTGAALGGPEFIQITTDDDREPDMYVEHDGQPAPAADLEFIASARNAIPRLIAEVRHRRSGA